MSDESLLQKVTRWLNGEGYPLEFETAKVFSEFKFTVEQGLYLEHSHAHREVDVLATHRETQDTTGFLFEFLVECKHLPQPWVLLTNRHTRRRTGTNLQNAITNLFGQAVLTVGTEAIQRSFCKVFDDPEHVGFQAFTALKEKGKGNNMDLCYQALRGVISNALIRSRQYEMNSHWPQRWEGVVNVCHVVVPLIVVQGKLFVSSWILRDFGERR